MKKQWLGNLISVVLLVVGLVAWIMSPWFVVAGLAVLLALWLFLTRSGRLSLEAARIGIASLPQRWGASSVIVVGIAGVVGVLVAMLAMGEGFKATLDKTGSERSAMRPATRMTTAMTMASRGRRMKVEEIMVSSPSRPGGPRPSCRA